MVECLPRMYKALDSIQTAIHTNKKKKCEGEEGEEGEKGGMEKV